MSIIIKNLSYTYMPKTPYEKLALDDISLTINSGEKVGIIGSTGSGKSTLIQHINGLIKLKNGYISVCDIDLTAKKPDLLKLRSMVGMLFQYPEYQLFEENVLKDVAYGPINFGMTKEKAYEKAKEAIELVGLDYEEVKNRSPFDLSGGQKRRVAIAGVIASNPRILVLDEPTAGLDPLGKREILNLITSLHGKAVETIIMISHNMDEIAEYTDRIIVLNDSKLVFDCTPSELFSQPEKLKDIGLGVPHTVNIKQLLAKNNINLDTDALTVASLQDAIDAKLGVHNG